MVKRASYQPSFAAMLTPALTALLLSLLFVGLPATALELGELRTQSALHAPFHAEITLLDADDIDLEQIEARLADPAAFEHAGLERPAVLTEMRFTPIRDSGDATIIEVTSQAPIREPYLTLLLELLWPDGQVLKDYAVLLDPPTGGEQAPADEALSPQAPPAQSPVTAAEQVFPVRYGPVPVGVGLTEVGRRLAMPGVTLEQIALTLYRNNPQAFVNGDINRLRHGAELVIPTRAELLALAPNAARRQYWAAAAGARIAQEPLTDVDAHVLSADQEDPARAEQTPVVIEEPAAALAAEDGVPTAEVEAESEAPIPEIEPEEVASAPAFEAEDATPAPEVEADERASTPAPTSAVALLEAERLLMRGQSAANRQKALELRARVDELEAHLNDLRGLLEQRLPEPARSEQQPAGADAEADNDAASAANVADAADADTAAADRSQLVESASGLEPPASITAWSNALPAWLLPLLAVALLLALLGLLLYRRHRRDKTAVAREPLAAPDTPAALDEAGSSPAPATRLKTDWPVADTDTATPSVAPGAPNDRTPLTDVEDTLIATPVVDPGDVATKDPPEADWTLEQTKSVKDSAFKLDLTRAYLDTGDPNAARALLKQVVAEGSDAQQRIAEAMLAELDGAAS